MSSSDDSLLARLNALRASTVTLSHPNSTSSSSPLSIPKPINSTESTLSSRLKALRTASETSTTSLPRPSSPPPTPAPISPKNKVPQLSLRSPHHGDGYSSPPGAGQVKAVFDDASRQAKELEEGVKSTKLFERNADEDLKLAREATAAADEVGKEIKMKWGDEGEIRGKDDKEGRLRGDAKKALERAKRTLAGQDGGIPPNSDDDGSDEDGRKKKLADVTDDTDDEDGDKKDEDEEADALLAELMDDVALDFEEDSRRGLHQQAECPGSPPQLPPPPSLITPVQPTSPKAQDTAHDEKTDEKDDPEEEDDFHRLMASRMSALRTPSPSSGLSLPSAPSTLPIDSLGLPSAPKDHISSLSVSQQPKEEYICKICYDKATIFCEGCEEEFEEYDTKDDAMFCARCWKEAHLGETADEEERGHQWVTVRRGK